MNDPHASQVWSNMGEKYIFPTLTSFVTQPQGFWSKITEILYQVLPSDSSENTKCRFHTEKGNSTLFRTVRQCLRYYTTKHSGMQ